MSCLGIRQKEGRLGGDYRGNQGHTLEDSIQVPLFVLMVNECSCFLTSSNVLSTNMQFITSFTKTG
jgi:hypothetical protein